MNGAIVAAGRRLVADGSEDRMSLPNEMRVVEIAEPGGPEVLRPALRRVPQPAAGEILIRVRAAGVNRPDVQQRAGAYAPPPGASDLPGLEAAGEVAAVGPRRLGLAGRATRSARCCRAAAMPSTR